MKGWSSVLRRGVVQAAVVVGLLLAAVGVAPPCAQAQSAIDTHLAGGIGAWKDAGLPVLGG